MDNYYIGLASTFHDPALAIVDPSGELVFAEATERVLQNKRAFGCPADHPLRIARLIEKYCDSGAGIVVANTWSRRHLAYLQLLSWSGALGTSWSIRKPLNTAQNLRQELLWMGAMQLSAEIQSGMSLVRAMRIVFHNRKIRTLSCSHHLTHAATACYSSPFAAGLCVIIDGFGEHGALAVYRYQRGRIQLIARQRGNASLGFFYGILTRCCGFDPLAGEEWKVMGLSPYGEIDDTVYGILRDLVWIDDGKVRFAPLSMVAACIDKVNARYGAEKSLREMACLAFTGQRIFADLMGELLGGYHALGVSSDLIYSGGCALNSAYNGRILAETGFARMYIPPAPADDGNALGAALLAYYQDHPERAGDASDRYGSPYLGSEPSERALERLIAHGGYQKVSRGTPAINARAAELLDAGKVVAVMRGRAEFGPRALGNRSILADPRCENMKARINERIKFREDYRPFAPSILHEYGDEYFIDYQASPYMERALRWRNDASTHLPAVTHVDGTGRVHSVTPEGNADYYDLLRAFHRRSGVPVLLNTSFNIMGKPIIHTIEDAVGVFATSDLDALILGDHLIEK